MRGVRVIRHEVHKQLWQARNRKDCVQIHQKDFAGFIGIQPTHMSRVIKDLVEDGRIKKIAVRKANIGVYLIRNPADFEERTGLTTP